MFLDFISHLISLDFNWFFSLIFSNIFLIFALYCTAYFFYEKKNTLASFFIVVFVIFAEIDFLSISGWIYYASATALALMYVSRVAFLLFVENIEWMKRYFVPIYLIHFYIVLTFFNLFMR